MKRPRRKTTTTARMPFQDSSLPSFVKKTQPPKITIVTRATTGETSNMPSKPSPNQIQPFRMRSPQRLRLVLPDIAILQIPTEQMR